MLTHLQVPQQRLGQRSAAHGVGVGRELLGAIDPADRDTLDEAHEEEGDVGDEGVEDLVSKYVEW